MATMGVVTPWKSANSTESILESKQLCADKWPEVIDKEDVLKVDESRDTERIWISRR